MTCPRPKPHCLTIAATASETEADVAQAKAEVSETEAACVTSAELPNGASNGCGDSGGDKGGGLDGGGKGGGLDKGGHGGGLDGAQAEVPTEAATALIIWNASKLKNSSAVQVVTEAGGATEAEEATNADGVGGGSLQTGSSDAPARPSWQAWKASCQSSSSLTDTMAPVKSSRTSCHTAAVRSRRAWIAIASIPQSP